MEKLSSAGPLLLHASDEMDATEPLTEGLAESSISPPPLRVLLLLLLLLPSSSSSDSVLGVE